MAPRLKTRASFAHTASPLPAAASVAAAHGPRSPMPFLPVGGQAVIEGVMMRSPSRVAVAVRRPGGAIALMEKPFASITRRHRLLGLPIVRGAVGLFETLAVGIAALNFSADEATRDESAAAGKPSAVHGGAQILTVALSLVIGVLVF